MTERSARRQSGISLLELVVALVIVALAVPALLGLYTTALQGIGLEQSTVRSSQLAQQRLEILYAAKRTGQLDFTDNEDFQDSCETAVSTFRNDGDTPDWPSGYNDAVDENTVQCQLGDSESDWDKCDSTDCGRITIKIESPDNSSTFRGWVYDLES
ncbi:MAG: prepilin-type N-terminal cleavage/methylation domain-containing protein [Ectothiorhodospiraceae bacterium]